MASPPIARHTCGWFRERSTIERGPYRLLCAAAGVVGILAVASFLPFFDPFFVPPFPTQYHRSWNIFALVPHPVWAAILFLGAFLAGVGLLVGRYQRRCALVLLLFMSGVIASARPLTSSSASVFCLLMVFLALMPDENDKGVRRGWAVFGLRLQVFLIYICGILFKLADPAWLHGYPLSGVLMGFTWSSHLGIGLSQTIPASFLNILGQAVTGVELVAPLAMFFGFRFPLVRRAGVTLLILLHTGMALLMTLELFPWVMITTLLVYWDEGMTKSCTALCKKVCAVGWPRIRETASLLIVALIILTALGQTFLPATGVRVGWIDGAIAIPRRQFRFDQHWGMFTHTSFEIDKESRARPDKSYSATRLFVRTIDGELWDPFTGRPTTIKDGLLNGASHLHSSRKAISYIYKSKGSWQRRSLRAMAQWATDQARRAGLAPEAVLVYRYAIPLDFSKSLEFKNIDTVRARIWFQYHLVDGLLDEGEEIHPRSIRSVRFSLEEPS